MVSRCSWPSHPRQNQSSRPGRTYLDGQVSTLPETNINGWLEDEFSFWDGLFSRAMLVLGRVSDHQSNNFNGPWVRCMVAASGVDRNLCVEPRGTNGTVTYLLSDINQCLAGWWFEGILHETI